MGPEMDKQIMKIMVGCRYWILVISMCPIAILLLIFMALGSLLRFLFKALLLFIIVVITTPFAMMSKVSNMMYDYYLRKHSARLWKLGVCVPKPDSDPQWNQSDPRASVGLEIQILVSDFLKTVASELLVVVSAGIITYYTAPLLVFYISVAISLVAILHKWLNTDCLSKTALGCLCDGYGLNPMMFLYSFLGLFNIGCHPVAKCSFAARRAFLFVEEKCSSNVQFIEKDGHRMLPHQATEKSTKGRDNPSFQEAGHYRFNGAAIPVPTDFKGSSVATRPVTTDPEANGAASLVTPASDVTLAINFNLWNAFERGFFHLSPRIDFKIKGNGKYILKTFMVLKLCRLFGVFGIKGL